MKIGNKEFDCENQTYVMGILNVTPDSFSDGGKYQGMDACLSQVETMLHDGMDILDIGGESTRPGYIKISDEEEIGRILPVIRAIKERFDVPISVDTYKSKVAEAALCEHADLINDIWGLKYDADMAKIIRQYDAACCLMHNRGKAQYQDFVSEVISDLQESIQIAQTAGIAKDKIILDPGIGFAKDLRQNLIMTNRLGELKKLGYPLLLGSSRKSMIGNTLSLPVTEREEGTLVTTTLAVLNGCAFVRVHNVRANKRAIKMTRAIITEGRDIPKF